MMVEAARQALQGVLTNLLAGGAEGLPIGALHIRRGEGGRYRGQQLVQLGPYSLGEVRIRGGLAEVPDAVAMCRCSS
jgi:hypothetical protein